MPCRCDVMAHEEKTKERKKKYHQMHEKTISCSSSFIALPDKSCHAPYLLPSASHQTWQRGMRSTALFFETWCFWSTLPRNKPVNASTCRECFSRPPCADLDTHDTPPIFRLPPSPQTTFRVSPCISLHLSVVHVSITAFLLSVSPIRPFVPVSNPRVVRGPGCCYYLHFVTKQQLE